MDIKNNQSGGEPENKPDSLWKQQINNFFIDYFSYLALAVALIIFVAGLFLFIYPQYKTISKSERLVKSNLEAKYKDKSDYLFKITNLKKLYQSISDTDRKKIQGMVPADSNITGLIPEIESIVLKNSAILHSIKITEEDSQSQPKAKAESGERQVSPAGIFSGQLPAGVKLVKIEINLASVDYQVLKNIIKAFENNLRLLDIAEISYNVQDNKVVLIIYTYYLTGFTLSNPNL